jgi:type I restriction enzyme, S subunit
MSSVFVTLPVHQDWPMRRARFLFSVRRARAEAGDEQLAATQSHGVLSQRRYIELTGNNVVAALAGTENFIHVERDDFVISLRTFEGGIERASEGGCISPAYTAMKPSNAVNPNFFQHLLKSEIFVSRLQTTVTGIREGKSVKFENFADIVLPVPDPATQKQIADFLDAETARIDALIEKKQRVLTAVADARFSTISRAVSVGLNSDQQLIETGSPYLPRIPATWQIWRLKHLARVRGGLTLGRTVPDGVSTASTPYLRVANVQAGWIDLSDVAEIDATEAEIKRFSLRRGDVLMNEGGDNDKLGRGAVWHAPFEPCLNQNHVFCVRPSDLRYSDWISMATNARYARDFFYLHSNQSTNLASISKTNVEKLPIAVPPPEEMRAVLDQLNARLDRFTATTEKVTTSINRLREYRAALITAAVTGQIDVAAHARPAETVLRRAVAEVVQLRPSPQPMSPPDRRDLRVLVAADVVHRLGADPYLGRTKLQKLMFLAEAHANINDIAGRYQRYRYGPYDDAMVQEIELGLRQDGYYDTREGTGVDREKVAFLQMSRAGGHRDALAAVLGSKTDSLRQLVDLFKGKDTEATEAVATLYAVWNDALIDGKQPDDAAIIRGFLQDWHPEKGKFKSDTLQTWLDWMRRHDLVPKGTGPRTVSTNTPSLFERE